MSDTELYAVTGNPIIHSMSPVIYNSALKGTDKIYTRLYAESAKEALSTAKKIGIKGLNITSPFKEEFVQLLDIAEERVIKIHACNTILLKNNKVVGYNTDPDGIIFMLRCLEFDPSNKKIVILGAGGASRSVCFTLKQFKTNVTIINRSIEGSKALAEEFGYNYTSTDTAERSIRNADTVISCLPRNINYVKSSWLRKDQLFIDANYNSFDTFKTIQNSEVKFIDGSLWLLGQAETAYKIFTGQTAPEKKMYEAIFMENQVKGKHIILCGMMGSGKTVIGRELTALNGMDFIDTDLEIEKMAHMSINEIFSVHGEEHFRRQEESVIKNILKRPPSVIALGGGALREINFIETVKRSGYVIWLWSDIINLIKRTNDGKRPLLKNDDPGKTLSELLKKRFGDYSRTSDIIIDTDNRTTEETARKIYNETNKII